MNDKCAAGTGRFLEMMARTLGLSLGDMSKKGLEWKENIVISSMCTVSAEPLAPHCLHLKNVKKAAKRGLFFLILLPQARS